jgi:hypothetical protein
MIPDKIAVNKFLGQCTARIAGTDNHNVANTVGMGYIAEFAHNNTPETVGKPDRNRTAKTKHEANHHAGPGHDPTVKMENAHAKNCQYRVGTANAEYLRCTDKSPDTAVQAENSKYGNRNHTPGDNRRGKALYMHGADLLEGKVIPDPQAKKVGNHRSQNVRNGNSGNFVEIIKIAGYTFSKTHNTHFLTKLKR